MDLMRETWRAVCGFEGWYEVSDLGRVRRVRPGQGTVAGSMLSPGTEEYPAVGLYKGDGKRVQCRIHTLVAAAFIGPCPEGHEVDHIDGNKWHCTPSNLEYVPYGENQRRAYASGLKRPRS